MEVVVFDLVHKLIHSILGTFLRLMTADALCVEVLYLETMQSSSGRSLFEVLRSLRFALLWLELHCVCALFRSILPPVVGQPPFFPPAVYIALAKDQVTWQDELKAN